MRTEVEATISPTPPEWAFAYECVDAVPPRGLHPNEELTNYLRVWLGENLAARLAYVLRRRSGLDGEPPETLASIGLTLGVSRERVRQLEQKGLRQLANVRRRNSFRDALYPRFIQEGERQFCARCGGALLERAEVGIKVKSTTEVLVALGALAETPSGTCCICGEDAVGELTIRVHAPATQFDTHGVTLIGQGLERSTSSVAGERPDGADGQPSSISRTPPSRAGRPWTAEDDERLVPSYKAGMDLERLATEMGRTAHALLHRLLELGYVLKLTPAETNETAQGAAKAPVGLRPSSLRWDQRETLLDPGEYLAWIEEHPPLAIIGNPGGPTQRSLARYLEACGFDDVRVWRESLEVAAFVVEPSDPTVPFIDEENPRRVRYANPLWAQRVMELEQLPGMFGAPDWAGEATSAYFAFEVLDRACSEERPPLPLLPTRFALQQRVYSDHLPGSPDDLRDRFLSGELDDDPSKTSLNIDLRHPPSYTTEPYLNFDDPDERAEDKHAEDDGNDQDPGDDSSDPAVSGEPDLEETDEFDNEHRFEMNIDDMAPEGMSPLDSLS